MTNDERVDELAKRIEVLALRVAALEEVARCNDLSLRNRPDPGIGVEWWLNA